MAVPSLPGVRDRPQTKSGTGHDGQGLDGTAPVFSFLRHSPPTPNKPSHFCPLDSIATNLRLEHSRVDRPPITVLSLTSRAIEFLPRIYSSTSPLHQSRNGFQGHVGGRPGNSGKGTSSIIALASCIALVGPLITFLCSSLRSRKRPRTTSAATAMRPPRNGPPPSSASSSVCLAPAYIAGSAYISPL